MGEMNFSHIVDINPRNHWEIPEEVNFQCYIMYLLLAIFVIFAEDIAAKQ